MPQDFNDFLTDNIDEITKESDCPLEYASFMKELMQEEFEKFKKSLSTKYRIPSLLHKAIEKNNIDLFKQILNSHSLPLREYLGDIFAYGRKEMLDEVLTYKEVSQYLLSSYKIYFMTAINSNFTQGQQVILNHFVPAGEKDIIRNELLKTIKGKIDIQSLRNIFTSPVLKEYVNANEIYMGGHSLVYTAWSIQNHKKEIFDILMSNNMATPVDLYANDNQILFYSVIDFKNEPEKLKESYYFNHLLYDKKIFIPESFFENFNDSQLKNEAICCVKKRNLFFKMNTDLNPDDVNKKIKL